MRKKLIQITKFSAFLLCCILLFSCPAYAHDPEGMAKLVLWVIAILVFLTLLIFIVVFQLYKKKKSRETHFIRSVILAAGSIFILTCFIDFGGITYIQIQYEIVKGKKTGIIDINDIGPFWDKYKLVNLKSFASLTNLRSLDLGRVPTRDEELVHLSKLKSLEILRIWSDTITDGGIEYLLPLENLKELDLRDSNISDRGLKHLSKLKYLQILWVGSSTITDEGIEYLLSLESLRRLALAWGGNNAHISDEGLKHLSNLKSLESLMLGSPRITDEGIAYLSSLENLKELELVGNTKISDNGLKHLSKLKSLEYLDLGYEPPITDEGISYLSSLKTLKGLKFTLSKSQISNEGLKHLSKLKSLEYLDLGTVESVTNEGIGYLTSLYNLKELRLDVLIDVQEVSVVHLSQMKSLRKLSMYMYPDKNQKLLETALPNCEFDWYYGRIHWKDVISIDKR